MCIYLTGVMAPASLWFDPGLQTVAQEDGGVIVTQDRVIHSDFLGEYHVIVRETVGLRPVCEGMGGPFTYRENDGAIPAVQPIDKWAGGSCGDLPPGDYIMETCWTVVRPYFGIVPPKTVCVTSSPFEVTE